MEAQLEQTRRVKRIVEQREREDHFVDVKQAAGMLHVSDATIRRYLTIGRLKRFKVGTGQGARTLLDRDQVMSLIKEA
jgi:DeoR/GlpR family transcriptional regulator of sugar metabolism